MAPPPGLEVTCRVQVAASPERVLAAFFDPTDLAEWWQVVRSVTVARPLGTYAVEWRTTEYRDDVLGRLGGTLHGTVIDYRPGHELFIADAFWSPPDGESIGPMALEIRCAAADEGTALSVRHSGEDDGPRWRRYFEVMAGGWQRSLEELKTYLEGERAQEPR